MGRISGMKDLLKMKADYEKSQASTKSFVGTINPPDRCGNYEPFTGMRALNRKIADDIKLHLKMENLTITKERVLAAAAKCSTAKETLKTLFPEAFEEELGEIRNNGHSFYIGNSLAIERRENGSYKDRGFFLGDSFKWEIVDDGFLQVLVPTLKK